MNPTTQALLKLTPTIIMSLSFIACVPYLYHGDIKHGLYWLFAGGLTYTVTYL